MIVQWFTRQNQEALLLAFMQIVSTLPFTAIDLSQVNIVVLCQPVVLMALLYTGIIATVCTLFLQMRFQHQTSPIHAAVIYALMPLFVTLFAALFNHENPAPHTLFGGGVIMLALLSLHISAKKYRT